MSNNVNTWLYERAADCIDYFEGQQPAILIEQAINDNDLEQLKVYVDRAEAEIFSQMAQSDPMTDERAEDMFREATDVY